MLVTSIITFTCHVFKDRLPRLCSTGFSEKKKHMESEIIVDRVVGLPSEPYSGKRDFDAICDLFQL